MPRKTPTLSVGDRVRFTRAWLQATCSCTGEVPRLRGTVTDVKPYPSGCTYVRVDWDTHYFNEKTTSVLAVNLERLPKHLQPQPA